MYVCIYVVMYIIYVVFTCCKTTKKNWLIYLETTFVALKTRESECEWERERKREREMGRMSSIFVVMAYYSCLFYLLLCKCISVSLHLV